MHNEIWSGLAYGASLVGVVCESLSSFVSPVLEEMLFSGLLANRLTKSFGVSVAVLGTPVCFALIHVVQFGIGSHLITLFLAGLSYTIIRFRSGSLRMAVFSHLAINFVIFVPKWAVAVMHFGQP
jgi:membrane protease YdiL (CAAX protease family)